MAIELSLPQQNVAERIYTSGAFKVAEEGGGFRGKLHEDKPDAPLFPYYLSIRQRDVDPRQFPLLCKDLAVAMLQDVRARGINATHVLGIPEAGDPIAWAVQYESGLHLLKINKIQEAGRRRIGTAITGTFAAGDQVLGVDDLVTEGQTKSEFRESVEKNGLVLAHLALGIDREQGGMESLRASGLSVSAVLTITQLLDFYLDTGRIDQQTNTRIRRYIASQQ